jgi:hypothetical protein
MAANGGVGKRLKRPVINRNTIGSFKMKSMWKKNLIDSQSVLLIALVSIAILAARYGFIRNFVNTAMVFAENIPETTDWPMPPLAKGDASIEPEDVWDIYNMSEGLEHVSKSFMLSDGLIIFEGGGAVSFLNLTNGKIDTIWKAKGSYFPIFKLSPNRSFLWLASEKQLFVIDIASRRVWPLAHIYGEGGSLVEKAIQTDSYLKGKVQFEDDGRLLIEWRDYRSTANWWGKTPEFWQMSEAPKQDRYIYSRAILSSPEEWFRHNDYSKRLPIVFEVSYNSHIEGKSERPKPVSNERGRFYAPIHDGVTCCDLESLSMPEFNLKIQLFNRYRNPKTMMPCGVGNEIQVGELHGWSNISSSTCSRFQGAYVERADDGMLLHVLNHGIGVPTCSAISGRLFAMSGDTEYPNPARYVSLWDASSGKLLAHFVLSSKATFISHPTVLLFSNDCKKLYCMTTNPHAELFIWHLAPEWTSLSKSTEDNKKHDK